MGSATSRLLPAAAVAALLLAAAPRASAQSEGDKKQAQALQAEGLRLMQKGDNQGAVAKFEEAFRLVASPKILFNMGKAHLALGDQAKALEELQRFLDEAPFAPKESRDGGQLDRHAHLLAGDGRHLPDVGHHLRLLDAHLVRPR